MVDRLGEEFAGHEAFLETGGTQAGEQVEIGEVGDLADEGVQVACKGHPAGPGAGDGEELQEWKEFKRMGVLAMGEFERRLLVAVGVGVPVEVRLEDADAVKDAGWYGSGGPHHNKTVSYSFQIVCPGAFPGRRFKIQKS